MVAVCPAGWTADEEIELLLAALHLLGVIAARVQAFDTSRYGGIEGTLKQVSASTFEDGEGKPPYYKAIVTLSRAYVGSDRMQNQIMPGMAVQADIRTGTRSVA